MTSFREAACQARGGQGSMLGRVVCVCASGMWPCTLCMTLLGAPCLQEGSAAAQECFPCLPLPCYSIPYPSWDAKDFSQG